MQANHDPPAEESEDEIISQIKLIGSQIFTSFSDGSNYQNRIDEEFIVLNIGAGLTAHDPAQRKYSYTDRQNRNQTGLCEQQPLLQAEMNQEVGHSSPRAMSQMQMQNNDVKQSKKGGNNFKKKITEQKQSKKCKDASLLCTKIDKILPPPLVLSRLNEPIGNFKEAFIREVYSKIQQEETEHLRNQQLKASKCTLAQLYQQKQPLYEKCMKDSLRKKMLLEQSRISSFEKELEGFVGTPAINNNIEIKGTFEERQQIEKQKRELHREAIVSEAMRDSTFIPHTNSPRKYSHIASKIKETWSPLIDKNSKEEEELPSDGDLKGLSQSLLRTGSFFSDDSQPSHLRNKSGVELKIRTIHELSNILEIEDANEE